MVIDKRNKRNKLISQCPVCGGQLAVTHLKCSECATELSGEFKVTTSKSEYFSKTVVLAIGRRGTPRKLGVPGEELSKVSYSLRTRNSTRAMT